MTTPYLYEIEAIVHQGNGVNMDVKIQGPDCDSCYNSLVDYLEALDTERYTVVSEGWVDEI